MKFKKLLSAAAATAMAASAFAGLATTANAAVDTSTINTFSESKVFTFENETIGELSSEKNQVVALSNGLYYYAGGTATGSKIEEAPLAGYTKSFNGANGDTGKAVLAFKAGAAGTVSIKFSSTTANDSARINAGSNNDFSITTANTIESSSEVAVSENSIVYISSRNTKNRVSIYEIDYTVNSTEPTEEPTAEPSAEPSDEPTAEPSADPTATPEPTAEPTSEPEATEEPTLGVVSEAKTWTMGEWAGANITETVIKDNLAYYGAGSYEANSKTFDDGNSYTGKIKLGGASTIVANKDLNRVFAFEAGEAGTVKVYVQGGGSNTRKAALTQTIGEEGIVCDVSDSALGILEAEVDAGMVYIYGLQNVGIFAIVYTPGATLDTTASVTAKTYAGTQDNEGAADAPVAVFAAEITPGTIAATGITWNVTAGEATTGDQIKSVTISGDAPIYVGFLITLESDAAKAAVLTEDSLTVTINE